MADIRVEHQLGEQDPGHPLGAEPGDERPVRAGQADPEEGEADRDRPRNQQREGDEGDEQRNVGVVAGGDDQPAEGEEGEHLQDRADVLAEDHEVVGDVVFGDGERDPADEGGDQAVAEGDVGNAVGEQAHAQRVDPLVAADDSPAGQVVGEPPRGLAEDDPDDRAEGGLPDQLRRLAARVSAGRGEDDEEEHERQRQPVVETRTRG